MKNVLLFLFLFSTSNLIAQIGSTTITFNDPSRTGGYGSGGGAGRQIQCEIYYPATSSGTNVQVSGNNYPVLVYGHGFVMSWDSYNNIWEYFVPKGYIVVFPRTEGSFSPVHEDFGKDLALIADTMKKLNNYSSSLFYQKLNNRVAVMGHSMGGGSSLLAAQNKTSSEINTIVNFAAAVTDPSSITAGQNITIPTFVISGQNDCVAPPAEHQRLEYDSLMSDIKIYAEIKGAGHCYFANSNFNCSFGEGTCSPNPSITREQQQDVAQLFSYYWLEYYLKDNCSAWQSLNDSLELSSRISTQFKSFNYSTSSAVINQNADSVYVTSQYSSYQWYLNGSLISGEISSAIRPSVSGNYYCVVTDAFSCSKTTNNIQFTATVLNGTIFASAITLNPNPFVNQLIINNISNSDRINEIKVVDVIGKQVVNLNSDYLPDNQKDIVVNTSELNSGIYFVNIITSSNKLSYKVVKK